MKHRIRGLTRIVSAAAAGLLDSSTLAGRAGAKQQRFADSTGTLNELGI